MQTLENDPVIISYARSAIGKYGGALSSFRPDTLLSLVLAEAQKRSSIQAGEIDEVVIGCANQAGEDNRNIARMATLLAGFSNTTPAITLNRLCASGLDAIIYGARLIMTGEAKVVAAGGVESMSRAPLVMAKSSAPFALGVPAVFDSALGWRFFNEEMRPITPPEPNGLTAERLLQSFKIDRHRQDHFALLSHQRAIEASRAALLSDEIMPLSYKGLSIKDDEGPRADTSLEKLAQLKAAFKDGGSVTAGNSSPLSDGAAVLLLSSHAYAKAQGLKPLARITDFAAAGVDPKVMGLGPVPATIKLMEKHKLQIGDFDKIEINEAFAAQVLAVIDSLKIDEGRVNEHGGAIALGHPLGCSGARIVISLINRLRRAQKSLGLATLCVGVGQGVSMAVEAL